MAVKNETYEHIFHPESHIRVHPDNQLLEILHRLQFKHEFDKSIMTSKEVIYGLSSRSNSSYDNNAAVIRPDLLLTVKRPDIVSPLKSLESRFQNQYRKTPALYLREGDFKLERRLRRRGWRKIHREAVMTNEGTIDDPSKLPGTAELVTTDRQWGIFKDILIGAHENMNPHTNPNGPTPVERITALDEDWQNPQKGHKIKPVIVFDMKGSPAAGAILRSDQRWPLGYIEGVGSIIRGGYANTALAVCSAESFRQGNTILCLTTAADEGPEEAFGKMGEMDWRRKFSVGIWTKEPAGLAA